MFKQKQNCEVVNKQQQIIDTITSQIYFNILRDFSTNKMLINQQPQPNIYMNTFLRNK